jgi:hypothetical protein
MKLAEREKIFARHAETFNKVKERMRTRRFAAFGQPGLNNAYLMSVALYHRHYALFERVLVQKGNSLKEFLLFFQGLAREKGNLIDKTREWVDLQDVRKEVASS